MPEITEEVFNYGIVKMFRTYFFNPKNQSKASQIELPYVRHKEYEITPGEWTFYTETVDYDFYPGKIFIYYTASDFLYETDGNWYSPEAMSFRCVAIY